MKLNLKKNLLNFIVLFLFFSINVQSLSTPTMYSTKDMNLKSLTLMPTKPLNTFMSEISIQNNSTMIPQHGIYFSCQLTNSDRHQFSQHINGVRIGLSPQELRKIDIQQEQKRMGTLDTICAIENPEHSLPSLIPLLQQVHNYLVDRYEKKAASWFTFQTTLTKLSAEIKFVDGLLSGKVPELLKQIKNSDINIAENAFNELQELWPYKHKGSFLDPDSHSKAEKKFIKQINTDVMKVAEGKLLANSSYIEKYASENCIKQIKRFEKDCISLQKQGDRRALYYKVESLRQEVKKNGKREDLVTNVCLAIATERLTAPITSLLDKIEHAPNLQKAQELVNYVNQTIKEYAGQNNVFRSSEITEMLINDNGFDPRIAVDDCYTSHQDYIMIRETGRCYNPAEYIIYTIEKPDLSTSYKELIYIKQQLAELFESHNVTDPIEQQNLLAKHFNGDPGIKAHASYTARSDVLNIAKLFTTIDVQKTTVRILKTSPNTQSIATQLQTVTDAVLDNARLCQIECVPQVEECILDSLKVLQKTQDIGETIYHVTIVDRILTDMQIQSHSVATGMLPTWQKSTELLQDGFISFIMAIEPITPAIHLASLTVHGIQSIEKAQDNFIAHPIDTTVNAAHGVCTTSRNVISTLINTARFACDLQLGELYLSPEEYAQRCSQFVQILEPLDYITANHVAKFCGHVLGTYCAPWALAKVYNGLSKIDAIGKISEEAKIIVRGIQTILEEQPAFATAEGLILKMDNSLGDIKKVLNTTDKVKPKLLPAPKTPSCIPDKGIALKADNLSNGPQEFINKAKESFEKAYSPIAQSITKDIDTIGETYKELAPKLKFKFLERDLIIDYDHILGVDIKWHEVKEIWKNFGGCHHDYAGLLEKSKAATITKITIRNDGCYYAKVLIAGRSQNRAFFPQHWSREQVAQKIWEAYENFQKSGAKPILQDNGTYKIAGLTSEGILIEMCITQGGKMNTAYPFFDLAKIYK